MSDRLQAEQAAARWIARRDTGPCSEAEAAALAAWLEQSAANRVAYYRLNGAWREAGRLQALVGAPAKAKRRFFPDHRLRWLALAASVLLVVSSALWVFQGDVFNRTRYFTVVGGLQAIPLPDGSTVTLNTDSDILVTVTQTERRVELEQGEAYFQVASDPSRPFVVSADGQRVIAVGTAFSVRRERDGVRVIVTEGKVRVEVPGKAAALTQAVPAGSVVTTASDAVLVRRKPIAEIEQKLSWRSGLLTFRETPLAEVADEFNRYNTRKIVISDPEIATIEIGGIFRATNLDSFVQLLQDGFPVRVAMNNDRIVLRSED